jgi:hypothetical protein
MFFSNEDRTNDTSYGLAAVATLILAVLVPSANSNFALVLALFWCYPAFSLCESLAIHPGKPCPLSLEVLF